MYFNAAIPSLCKPQWVAGAGLEASQICFRVGRRINIGPDSISTLPSTDYWINLPNRQTKKPT